MKRLTFILIFILILYAGKAGAQCVIITNPAPVCSPATVDITAPAIILGSAATSFSYYTDITGTIPYTTPTNATNGTYYIKGDGGSGCPDIKAVTVTVTALPVATFSYDANPYCSNKTNPSPTFNGGGIAGTFSSTGGLVFVSTSTGQINLSASTAGTYTVTNTIAAAGGCGVVTATTSITITSSPVATFSYTTTPYCSNESNPSPTFGWGVYRDIFINSRISICKYNNRSGKYCQYSRYIYSDQYDSSSRWMRSCNSNKSDYNNNLTSCHDILCRNSFLSEPASSQLHELELVVVPILLQQVLTINAGTGAITPSTSTAGTYTVTYTIAASGGCGVVTATTSITITSSPVATFSYTTTPYCSNESNPSPTFNGGGIAGTFSSTGGLVFVSTSTGQINLSASTAGTYTVTNTIAAAGGCVVVTATSQITITTLPAATISYAGTPFCRSQAGGQPVTRTGAGGGTYSSTAGLTINAVTGDITPNTSTAGTYTVTYTIAASGGCGVVTATTSITITSSPVATFSYTTTPYCSNESNPSPTFGVGGIAGTFSSTGGLVFVSTSTGQINLSASTAGTYTVTNTIAAAGGCVVVTATSQITITTLPAATISYAGTPFCRSQAGGQPVTRTGAGGGTYSSTAGLTINAVTGDITPNTSTAGTYTVTYTIAASGGCGVVTATTSITITSSPVATFSYTTTPYCSNESNPSPTFGVGGIAGTFSSTGGLVFVSTSTGQINLSASTAGTYTVTNTIAAAGGCVIVTATTSITITSSPVATFSYTTTPYCSNEANPSPTFSGGGIAGTFSSTVGLVFVNTSTGQVNLAASTAGTYTVTNSIPSAGGCGAVTANSPITITTLPAATIFYSGSPWCSTADVQNVTLVGTSGGTYSAVPAGLSINISTGAITTGTSTAGTYTVTYTIGASGGCGPTSANTSVMISPTPSAPGVGSITQTTCSVPSGSVILINLPSTGAWILTRNPGNVTTAGSGTSTTISNLAPGSYTFTVTSSAGCVSPPSANVVINAQPASPATPVQSVNCSLGFGHAVVTVTSPTGAGLEYSFDGGVYQSSPIFNSVNNGSHYLSVRNAAGCTTTGTLFSVSCGCINPPTLTISSSSGSTCGTTAVTVTGNSFGGTATSVTISSNGAGNVNPSSTNTSPFAFTYTPDAADGGKIVIITVATNNPLGAPCAAAVAAYSLTVNALPAAPVVGTITNLTCTVATGSVILNGLPAIGTWTLIRNPGTIVTNGTGTSTTVTGLVAGTYNFMVTSAEGCTSVVSSDVVITPQPSSPPAPVIGIITQPTCAISTGSVVLSGLPGTGTWLLTRNPGGVTISGSGTTAVSVLPAGTYTFTVTNSTGCISSPSGNVLVNTQPLFRQPLP